MRNFLVVALMFLSVSALAQTPNTPTLPGFPSAPHWRNNPIDSSFKDGVLTIKAGEKTDWYIAPIGPENITPDTAAFEKTGNSPLLLFPAPKDFWFSAKVTVDFKSQFDAGALILYANEKTWLKFAFESPDGKTGSIVSVVTRGLSDDATGQLIDGNTIYLEVSKSGQGIFLFYSADGKHWNVTRVFTFGPEQPLQFGFSSQSPTGKGATVTFSEIRYKAEAAGPWTAK